jgi:hypothetical protein
MRREGELHWMLAAGVLLMLLSVMLCAMIFLLPVFEGKQMTYFAFMAAPPGVIGATMLVLYRLTQS